MLSNQEAIDRGFDLFRSLLDEDADLRSEFENSRAEFFRHGDPSTVSAADALAARRHLEWFLLERESERLGALPVEVLLERGEARAMALAADRAQAFIGSHCGVFEVTGVESGEGLWLRDLASHGEYATLEPEASQMLRRGDLIVGRLFPVGDSLHHISRAASFFRNPDLLTALRADLESARASRRGVLRLTQNDIESMFYGPRPEAESPDAVSNARALLINGGLSRDDVDEILEQLANEEYSSATVLPGARDVLGEVLDRLAFESSLDLEHARRALLLAWADLSRSGPGRGASVPTPERDASAPAPISVAEAVAAYERKRRNGENLESALRDLEQALAVEAGADGADEEETPAPDFPGVVGAMIEEFLWESERDLGRDRTSELECLRSFGRFAHAIGVFENLTPAELVDYTCRWLPESDELENGDSARRLLCALQMFCRWVAETQDLDLYSRFKSTLSGLQDSLPRLAEANRRRTRAASSSQGEFFEFISLDAQGSAVLRDDRGRDHTVHLEPDLGMWLRAADRVRGHVLPDGRVAVYCCYPGQSAIGRRDAGDKESPR